MLFASEYFRHSRWCVKFICYPKTSSLLLLYFSRVRVQNGNDKGRVFPPLVVIEYSELSSEALQNNVMVPLQVEISFEMDNNIAHAIEVGCYLSIDFKFRFLFLHTISSFHQVSIIVLSVLSIVWAGIQTLSYSRRAGKVGVDLASLFRLVLLTCGRLSDSFFIAVAGAATHTFLFYKGQSVPHMLLPGPYEEYVIFTYVVVAFSLKVS